MAVVADRGTGNGGRRRRGAFPGLGDPPAWLLAPRDGVRHLFRRGRVPGLRTAKTTAAAVLSFVIAEQLGTSAALVLAPLTALLVVQLTMSQTLR